MVLRLWVEDWDLIRIRWKATITYDQPCPLQKPMQICVACRTGRWPDLRSRLPWWNNRDRQATLFKELETLDPEVANLAIKAVGTAEAAVAWLIQPALGLDGNSPVRVLRTHGSKDQVMRLLGRIEHNVLSQTPDKIPARRREPLSSDGYVSRIAGG